MNKQLDRLYFIYERMEPKRYPEPRDIRLDLKKLMVAKYKDQPLTKITLSTEFILKSIKPSDGSPERPILKYKVINCQWDMTKEISDIKFDKKMFRWEADQQDYEYTGGLD